LTIDNSRALIDLARIARASGLACVIVVVYVFLEWASFIHEYKGMPVTPWNPGLGLVLAVMVVGGVRYAAVLFIGDIAAEIIVLKTSLGWPAILSIATIHSVGYGALAAILRGPLRIGIGLNRLRDVLILLSAGAGGAAVVTFLLTAIFVAEAPMGFREGFAAFWPTVVGDAIGIAVVTPLMLRLMRLSLAFIHVSIRLALEVVAYLLIGAIALWVLAIGGAEQAFFYLLFLPVVVAAARFGIDGACISLALMQSAVVALLLLHDYDIRTFTQLQTLMLTLTVTGLIVGVVVSERQNSDRLARDAEARLKEKEAEAAQAARLNLVSSMASALAHEINQPMTAARALARSAQHILRTSGGGDLPRADDNLTTLIAEIDHASGVVRHMRDFLRRGRPHINIIDIRSMLEEALTLVRAEASGNHIDIELDISSDLPPAQGDRVQLQQVILNLIRNAIESIVEARQTDGHIRIVARRLEPPQRIEIGVSDNGPGVGDELAERLFDPLTTSKHEGLGLGLPICTSIVESHGGRIWLQTRQVGATEFRFSLPLEQSQAV
jgi:two-component system sensor kinase FixL